MRLPDLVDVVVVAYAIVEVAVGHAVRPDHFVALPVAVDPGHARTCPAQDNGCVGCRCAVGVCPAHLDDLTGLHPADRVGLRAAIHVRMTVPCVVVLV